MQNLYRDQREYDLQKRAEAAHQAAQGKTSVDWVELMAVPLFIVCMLVAIFVPIVGLPVLLWLIGRRACRR